MPPLLIFLILSFLSISRAQDRSHGLRSRPPIAISPQAYAFFHSSALPPTMPNTCGKSPNRKKLPLAATVKSTPAHGSAQGSSGQQRMGPGSLAGISLGFALMCLIGIGVYHVMVNRRANLRRANNLVEQKPTGRQNHHKSNHTDGRVGPLIPFCKGDN